ncbi:MAG: ferrous iron transport protein B [Candidatus Omnitrophica bacterium]|nr:ferrous iron transport protein B [Candidatus Omnitrophota bacterium]
MIELAKAKAGKQLFFSHVQGGEGAHRKLMDMGLVPGEKIRIVQNTGKGQVMLEVKGAKIAIGHGLAEKMIVEEEKMEKETFTIALTGNPNCGKSTLFNNLTGARQHVANYPGVTVDTKEGEVVFENYRIKVVDLPGTYSLSARSEDEYVARNYIIENRPDIVVNVIDASNLERNLYLATQLMELEVPMILAMNMTDLAEDKGQSIDYAKLSGLFGVETAPTIGSRNIGTKELLGKIVKVYRNRKNERAKHVDYGPEISEEINKLEGLLRRNEEALKKYPLRWMTVKLIENDRDVTDVAAKLPNGQEITEQAQKSEKHLKAHFGDPGEILIADRRYGFISGACTVSVKQTVGLRHTISDRIDKIVLNRMLGLPIFALVMYGIFKFTFTFSGPVVGWFEAFFEKLSEVAASVIPEGLLQSLVVDGIIGGVGGVLGFFPLILFMFFAIAFFEDTGYMARAAFVMDKIMSKFGLHGKSFLPMMISTNGCTVPGIMASRTLDSKRDRLITMMVTPFMICGAKLPIFALFIGAFFPAEHGANIMFAMYALSVVIAFGSAWLLKKLVFKGEDAHFVMELPPYRIPTIKGLVIKMWERGWMYLKKAGTIIVLISVIIWAGFTFPIQKTQEGKEMSEEEMAAVQMEQSYAGRFGHLIEPLMKPIGLDWRSGIALTAGIAAKEVVVSTYGTIYSLGEVDPEETETLKEAMQSDPAWSPLKALAFLMFCLIYLPCFVAMAVFYRESGSKIKWTLFLIFWTTVMAWGAAFIVYQGGRLIGLGG